MESEANIERPQQRIGNQKGLEHLDKVEFLRKEFQEFKYKWNDSTYKQLRDAQDNWQVVRQTTLYDWAEWPLKSLKSVRYKFWFLLSPSLTADEYANSSLFCMTIKDL